MNGSLRRRRLEAGRWVDSEKSAIADFPDHRNPCLAIDHARARRPGQNPAPCFRSDMPLRAKLHAHLVLACLIRGTRPQNRGALLRWSFACPCLETLTLDAPRAGGFSPSKTYGKGSELTRRLAPIRAYLIAQSRMSQIPACPAERTEG